MVISLHKEFKLPGAYTKLEKSVDGSVGLKFRASNGDIVDFGRKAS